MHTTGSRSKRARSPPVFERVAVLRVVLIAYAKAIDLLFLSKLTLQKSTHALRCKMGADRRFLRYCIYRLITTVGRSRMFLNLTTKVFDWFFITVRSRAPGSVNGPTLIVVTLQPFLQNLCFWTKRGPSTFAM